MKVKDLIEKLEKCDPEANVGIEAFEDPTDMQQVIQYTFEDGVKYVYICDKDVYLDSVVENVSDKISL